MKKPGAQGEEHDLRNDPDGKALQMGRLFRPVRSLRQILTLNVILVDHALQIVRQTNCTVADETLGTSGNPRNFGARALKEDVGVGLAKFACRSRPS